MIEASRTLDQLGYGRSLAQPRTPPTAGEWDALEGMAKTLTSTGFYRVIRRFQRRERYSVATSDNARQGLYVDVETTGLDVELDSIIELAVVPFEFDRDGVVYEVGEPVVFFEDPGRPIPPEITSLTGITDDMVRGQRIDDAVIAAILKQSVIVIAHNAEFDRKMLERRIPAFADIGWGCSQRDIPWAQFGCSGTKLEYLLFRACGEFHDGHHAADDCLAAIHLLANAHVNARPALAFLLDSARQSTVRLWAIGAPFDTKDRLKARKYRWSPGDNNRPKAWFRDLLHSDVDAEQAWLRENIYAGHSSPPWRLEEFGAKDRYSTRV